VVLELGEMVIDVVALGGDASAFLLVPQSVIITKKTSTDHHRCYPKEEWYSCHLIISTSVRSDDSLW